MHTHMQKHDEDMCDNNKRSSSNCVHKRKPFGTLPKRRDRRKKNEEEEKKNEEDEVDDDDDDDDEEDDDDVKKRKPATKIRWCECGKKITTRGYVRSGEPCCQVCHRKARAEKMNENCVVCKKKITSNIRRHPKIKGDDGRGKPCCEGCYDKTRAETMNENCVVCKKKITSKIRRHPTFKGDDGRGKPCCEGCYRKAHAKKMNEKCVVCKKKITGRIRRHPKIEGDDKSGEPCCEGCYTKALDKAIKAKNLKLRNFCERCVALRRKEVGGRYARKCEITSEVYWRCFECQRRGVQNRYRNEKRKREGLGPPRKFTRRKLSWIL